MAERTHTDVIRAVLAWTDTPMMLEARAALDALTAEVAALTERTRQADAVSVKERIRARTAEAQLAAAREALTAAERREHALRDAHSDILEVPGNATVTNCHLIADAALAGSSGTPQGEDAPDGEMT